MNPEEDQTCVTSRTSKTDHRHCHRQRVTLLPKGIGSVRGPIQVPSTYVSKALFAISRMSELVPKPTHDKPGGTPDLRYNLLN